MTEPILFRSTIPRWRFLSDFYQVPGGLTFDGRTYRTAEHLYPSLKVDPNHEEYKDWTKLIHRARTPGEAKRLGRQAPLDPEFNPILAMTWTLMLKFVPGEEMARRLLTTGDASLVEDNPGPWGGRSNGDNWLGVMLEVIREELRQDMTTPWADRTWPSEP